MAPPALIYQHPAVALPPAAAVAAGRWRLRAVEVCGQYDGGGAHTHTHTGPQSDILFILSTVQLSEAELKH